MAIISVMKVREWAWKNKHSESVDHFNRVQKKWSFWGVTLVLGIFVLGVLDVIVIPAYHDYVHHAKQVEDHQYA